MAVMEAAMAEEAREVAEKVEVKAVEVRVKAE